MPLETPILFIVFNRPRATQEVFEAIRRARPERLYIASDGPRPDHADDVNKILEVREFVSGVDWPCRVRTLFRESNFGCKRAPSLAISWFLDNEESGIILEDDCVPHDSFFRYCEWALDFYREDERVWHINGNSFAAPKAYFRESAVSFVSLAQVWGWATWRDRWRHFDVNPFYVAENAAKCHRSWLLSPVARANKMRHLDKLVNGLDAWDFQWQATILNARGLVLCPQVNLITNIGDDSDATHTPGDPRARLPTEEFSPTVDPAPVKFNHELNGWYEKNMGLRSSTAAVAYVLDRVKKNLGATGKLMLSRAVYGVTKNPIVVASAGRSGSTLLWETIAWAFVERRFGSKLPSFMKRALKYLATEFEPRLTDGDAGRFPVIKTHDVVPAASRPQGTYVFIFGDPIDSIRSVHRIAGLEGEIWLQHHLYHLCSHGDLSDLYQNDILNYEAQIKSWTGGRAENVLLVCYEDLWDRLDKISDFVGLNLKLPPKQARQSSCVETELVSEALLRLRIVYENARRLANG